MRCIHLCDVRFWVLISHAAPKWMHLIPQEEWNFLEIVSNAQSVLKLWQFRNLILDGRIVFLKGFAISKIVFQALMAPVAIHLMKTIRASFLWNNFNSKLKHKTLCNNCKNGDLKKVGIRNKVNSLQVSWVKRLYDYYFREWKTISLNQLKKMFGPFFKVYSNLSFKISFLKNLLSLYRHMLISRSQDL